MPLEDLAFEEHGQGQARPACSRGSTAIRSTTSTTRSLARVERPLFDLVLAHTGGNQLKAAEILGLNRNTLRKKLAELGMDKKKKRLGREDRALDNAD